MTGEFSANASAPGYFYQARYALFLLLSRAETEAEMSIERLDDISFERDGNPTELLQIKHQIKSTASLSDAGADLWKTLGTWSAAIAEGSVNFGETILTLLTTGHAPKDSAASKLRPHATQNRDATTALKILREVAVSSESQTNRPAYEAFLSLSEIQQRALVSSIHVLDSSPDIVDTRGQILKRMRISVRQQFLEAVYERVEEWWFNWLIQRLSSDSAKPISYPELLDQINDIQDQYRGDDLQCRAFQQRSKSVREDLLFVGELEEYEKRLVDDWEKRPIEIAYLLNPAFCGELLRRCIRAHNAAAERQFPFPLVFLLFPIVLHRKTRESISANTKEQMHVWLQNHQDVRIGFADRARELVPIMREALAFLLHIGAIAVDNRAGLRLKPYDARKIDFNQEIMDCFRKAEILGRWFARAGSTAAIYTMWGVRP